MIDFFYFFLFGNQSHLFVELIYKYFQNTLQYLQ